MTCHRLVSELIDVWLQRQWLALQPIFVSPDINKQLPAEGRNACVVLMYYAYMTGCRQARFEYVNKAWRVIVPQVHNNPDVLSFCDNQQLFHKLQVTLMSLMSDYRTRPHRTCVAGLEQTA